MSTVLESNNDTQHIQTQLAARRMRATMAAIKVVFTWLGTTKTLSTDQKIVAADVFGADGASISASKRLLDPKHPALAAVTKIKGRVTKFWKDNSLPFPEGGIRLIRHDQIAEFDETLNRFRSELDGAVVELERHYDEMRSAARDRPSDRATRRCRRHRVLSPTPRRRGGRTPRRPHRGPWRAWQAPGRRTGGRT